MDRDLQPTIMTIFHIEESAIHPGKATVCFTDQDGNECCYTFGSAELAQVWVEGRQEAERAAAQG